MSRKNRQIAGFKELELFEKICSIMELQSMRVTVSSSMKSGILVGSATALGALLLGPRGAAVAGVLGSLATSYMMDGTFKSVPQIIMTELTDEQRYALFKDIVNFLIYSDIMNIAMLVIRLKAGDVTLINDLVKLIRKFLQEIDYDV
ncbi:hypothetical protein PV327_005618 [Microctonus hyperodae]|uniref:Uncharacterized protein n=1 Tax=Microctonus hyperodae TaxID=165561 RepID=A0AA39KZX7_MICHY|nr:hypothetical protein PV327_005618 [Microctonus hyperodae]